MSESSSTPAGDVPPFDPEKPARLSQPFDVEAFAIQTIQSVEYGDAIASVLEDRVLRIEEIIAARWPRRWILRWRLAREIRASAATWDPEFIPKGDFIGRRYEAVSHLASQRPEVRRHRPAQSTGWQQHTGWDSAETGRQGGGEQLGPPWVMPSEDEQPGGADPGEGFLP